MQGHVVETAGDWGRKRRIHTVKRLQIRKQDDSQVSVIIKDTRMNMSASQQ